MRRLAVQRGDRIIQASPNGIVILNDRLEILAMNPAFRRMFMAGDDLLGKRVSYLLDPEPFELMITGEPETSREAVPHDKYGLICREIYYALDEEQQYVGMFVDVTDSTRNREKLDELRTRTIAQARELLDHQVQLAQRITQELGESTARGEALASRLMNLRDE
jgi:sensor histidine kinase regulating citrate/malate metabolism